MQIEELKPFFFPDCTENCLISLLYFLSLYHDNRKKWHIWIFLSSWIFDNTKVSDCQQKLLAFGRSSVSIQPFLVYKVHPFLQEWTRENFVSPYPRGRRTGSEEASQLDSAAKYEKATNSPSRSTVAFIDCAAETFPAPSFTKLSGASLVAQQQRICLQCRKGSRRRSDPRLGRSPGGGHCSLLQYSCLQKPGGLQSIGSDRPSMHECSLLFNMRNVGNSRIWMVVWENVGKVQNKYFSWKLLSNWKGFS